MGRDTVPGFAAKLRALREAKLLSIDALAELAGVHRDSIAKLERGERAPSLRLAFDLADALGIKVDDFRGGSDMVPEVRGRGRPKAVAKPAAKRGRKS